MDLRRYQHPGKFEGGLLIDVAVYSASLDGCGETESDGDGGESYTRIDGPLDYVTLDVEDGGPLNKAESAFLAKQAGAILYESTNGFVDVTYFENPLDLDNAWAEIQEHYARFDDEESEDD